MAFPSTPDRLRPTEVAAFLDTSPSLDALRDTFPVQWRDVHAELDATRASGRPLEEYVRTLASAAAVRPSGKGRARRQHAVAEATVKRHIAKRLIETAALAAVTGRQQGTVRFGVRDGKLLQRLLFERDLVRKPVSMTRFRLTWPLVRQRDLLMPLVQPKGIYCFYSSALISALSDLIGERLCVEIAAGDGTLARLLTQAGTAVVATDDGSWEAVTPGSNVLVEDAVTTLRTRSPQVVLCSWPPAGNAFEQEVFCTPSVQTYVVLGSRHAFATGNHDAYRRQRTFVATERPDLAALVLPPEIEPAVWVFERRDLAAELMPGDSTGAPVPRR